VHLVNAFKGRLDKVRQTKWNHELSGSHTRQLIPEVGIRLHFPNDRDTGISYCHLLLNDTMLNEDADRTGVSDTPVCDVVLIESLQNISCYTVLNIRNHETS